MPNGLFIALFGAISWAINSVLVRRLSSRTGESFTTTAASIYFGVPFFAIVLTLAGDWSTLATVSLRAFILLVAAGVVQLLVGRWLNYYAFQQIGANKAGPLTATTPLYAVIFAVVFLNESLTAFLAVGVLCIMAGVALITGEKRSTGLSEKPVSRDKRIKGILAALGAALCYGTSSVAVKAAITETGSPYASIFIYFVSAAFFTSFLLIGSRRRQEISGFRANGGLVALAFIVVFGTLSQLFINVALNYSPASRVIPLYSTNVLLVFLISYLFNSKMETFTVRIFLGMLAVVLGAFLVFH
jgi:drug/metabolite transporter (DMT)-like permease